MRDPDRSGIFFIFFFGGGKPFGKKIKLHDGDLCSCHHDQYSQPEIFFQKKMDEGRSLSGKYVRAGLFIPI